VAATTRGVAPLAGACSQGVPLLSAELEVLNGTPQSLRGGGVPRFPAPESPVKIARFCPAAGIQQILRSQWGMSPQGAGVGWRSSRPLVPKQFCGSALACGC